MEKMLSYFSQISTYYQLVCILLTGLFSFLLTKFFLKHLPQKLRSFKHFFLLLWAVLLGIGFVTFCYFSNKNGYLLQATLFILATAFSTSLLKALWKKPLVSLTISLLVWTVVLFEITGLFQPTVHYLDKLSLQLGSNKLSVLLICKSLFVIGTLFWIAHFSSKKIDQRLEALRYIQPSMLILSTKLVRVFLFGISIIIGLTLVGIDLSVFAFFAGAIGVAIAFGVQNIFSNFISGFILLIDRSVKPGDVISLNDGKIYGVVHKLNARYVSLRTQEGKEHLIPNEQFIANKLENWSYSDPNVRMEIPFRVSYESDLELVEKLLIEIAEKTNRVLKKPAPSIRFSSLIDNAVEMKLRVWISDPFNGMSDITSAIIFQAWKAFQKNKIKIPYPPREMHMSSNHHPFFEKSTSDRL